MRYTAIATWAVFGAACAADRSAEWSVSVDTLPSGTVHVINAGEGRWSSGSRWSLMEAVKIGERNEAGPALFGDISDIDVDPLGRLYVLDRMAQEIRVFEADGQHIRTIGRLGSGPGEFLGVTGIAMDPQGRLWTLNQVNLRFSVFDSSGALFAEYPWNFRGAASAQWMSTFDAAGHLLHVVYYWSPTGVHTGLVSYDPMTQQDLDTLPTAGLPEGAPPLTLRVWLAPQAWWIGAQHEYRVWNVTHRGDTLKVVERRRGAERLSPAERDSARREEQALQRRVVSGSLDMDTERRPIFEALAVDPDGYLWVILAPEPGERDTRLDVFDPDGVYLGELVAPHTINPRVPVVFHGQRLYYVIRDEMDVAAVVGVDIQRGP
ncbi:MAG TPA: 6-bladed beta-propeller [Gemmatimonadales bacterium]